ncbi:hypothetical protein CsatB_019591 [Cannabis sativa]|uniref:uncharacterized protein LOC115699961 n=1 Tax=Cannabis sativa TaxID=3483 RepID=UPI0029C9F48A|nr:uncharacterized protein LOC115699961 [Cannabis sativa]
MANLYQFWASLVPDATNPNIILTHPTLSSATVANLMGMDSSSWDEEIIMDLYEERDRRLIKSIPLQASTASNQLFWIKEVLALEPEGATELANLLWRAYSECLLTLLQLRVKRVVVCTLCSLCRESEETTLHFLVTLSLEKKGIVIAVYWAIWGAQNYLFWKNNEFNPGDAVVFANFYLDQWKNATKSNMDASWSKYQTGDGREHWTPPNVNSIKINMDATLFKGSRSYGIGLVARDYNVMLIEGRNSFSHSMVEPSLAEAIGMKEALSWIKKRQWQNDCKSLFNTIGTVSFSFVKQSVNVVAHNFAKAAILFPNRHFSLEDVPTDLLPCLVVDVIS